VDFIAGEIAQMSALVPQAQAEQAFFNTPSVLFGYANVSSQIPVPPMTFNATLVNNLLHGVGPFPGWLNDVQQGTGLIGFAKLLANASLTSTLAGAYGFQVSEAPYIAGYLNFLLTFVSNQLLVSVGGAQTQAYNMFYGQWANATLFPSGLDLNFDGRPDGFELSSAWNNGSLGVTGMPLQAAINLWNQSRTDSILSVAGITAWATALQAYQTTGNEVLFATLATQVGIPVFNVPLMTTFGTWLGTWIQQLVIPFIEMDTGVTNLTDLAYLQWGTASVLDYQSVANYDHTIPAPPEWAIFVQNFTGVALPFNLTISKQLLNGPMGFMVNTDNVPTFLTLLQRKDFTSIAGLWGLNVTEANLMGAYFSYLIENFVGM